MNKFLICIDQDGSAVRLGTVNPDAMDVSAWMARAVNPDLVVMARRR